MAQSLLIAILMAVCAVVAVAMVYHSGGATASSYGYTRGTAKVFNNRKITATMMFGLHNNCRRSGEAVKYNNALRTSSIDKVDVNNHVDLGRKDTIGGAKRGDKNERFIHPQVRSFVRSFVLTTRYI